MLSKTRLTTRASIAGAALAVAGLVLVLLAATGVFSSGSSTIGHVKLVTTANTTPPTPNAQTDPFGAPTSKPDYAVPPPPGEPTLAPTVATKTTTRIYGANPFQEAASVTQHIWPAALPENAPNENNNDPDRPWGLTLLTPDDPLTAITAAPLIHFPDDAPVLYVGRHGIPPVTANEIKRLGDTGNSRFHNIDAFLVGAAANPGVEKQLKAMGLKYAAVTAPNIPALANTVDKLYGSIQNPDTGVPGMGGGATMGGGSYNVVAPIGRETMGGLLEACVEATGRSARLVWAPDEVLVRHGVQQWTELPLWRTHAGVWTCLRRASSRWVRYCSRAVSSNCARNSGRTEVLISRMPSMS